MRSSQWITGLCVLAFAFLIAFPSLSLAGEEAKTEVSSFLVSSPHTAEECLATLDEIAASSKDALDNWYWGCKDGDHTGYEIVKASSKDAALKTVPENLSAKAKAVKIDKLTAEQVASFHKTK
jgi:hypothetical protein